MLRHAAWRVILSGSQRLLCDRLALILPETLLGGTGMEITEAILSYGVRAIRLYRTISNCDHDNQVPELFITSLMATFLSERLPWHFAKLEHLYLDVASDLRVEVFSRSSQAPVWAEIGHRDLRRAASRL